MFSSESLAGPALVVDEVASTTSTERSRERDYRIRLDGIDVVRAIMVHVEWPQADPHSLLLSLSPPYAGTRAFRTESGMSASGPRFAMVFPTQAATGSDANTSVLAMLRGESPAHGVAAPPSLTAQVVTREGKKLDLPVLYTQSAALQEAAPLTTQLAVSSSNPSSGTTRIRYTISQRGEAALLVFDSGGRKVRTLASGVQEPGAYSLSWDERDDAKRSVPAGVYFLRLLTRDSARVHKLVVIR